MIIPSSELHLQAQTVHVLGHQHTLRGLKFIVVTVSIMKTKG